MTLFRIIVVFVSIGALTGCPAPAPRPMDPNVVPNSLLPKEIQYPQDPHGYLTLIPPRSDFGPGFVFKGSVQSGALIIDQILCTNLYPDVKPASGVLQLASATTSSNNSLGLNLSLLQKLVGTNTVSLDAKYTGKMEYKVTVKTASADYLPSSSLFDGKTPRPVDSSCRAAIENLKLAGPITKSVYIIGDAVAVTGLTYSFTKSSDPTLNITADIQKIVNASTNASFSQDANNVSIDVTVPVHIAVKYPYLVDTWVPSGAVAAAEANTAIIAAHPLTVPISSVKSLSTAR